jgi:uncharacterized cysteine cluster protein YcgN (CxxCxxCC family)
MSSRWWEGRSLASLNRGEWEALCDGCGKCCLHKLEDEETGERFATSVACKLLDRRTGRCGDYARRKAHVPDCVRLTPALVRGIDWLPDTCAYRLVDAGQPLPDWHHLVGGDRDAVQREGHGTRGWTVSETDVEELEDWLVEDGG